MTSSKDTFAHMGTGYQEKVVQALMTDNLFADQMADVIDPNYFEQNYLSEIVSLFYKHKSEHKVYPSIALMEHIVDAEVNKELVKQLAKTYLSKCEAQPLNGDASYIQTSSLDFCKKQTLKQAIMLSIDKIEDAEYDSVSKIIKDALNKGSTRDFGHEYISDFHKRATKSVRKPISTGWPVIDRELNGGWERGTLTTFIAPTGAGKSMFLCNCSAAAIEQGLNSVYITCEMADYKIGLRHDSYFSEVPINNVPNSQNFVESAISEKVRGKLFIKEYPTKTASVQTIRAYLQRLESAKDFKPDIVVVDYADLLRSSRNYGEKRHELEGVYEELRAMAQELRVVVITADQTNRSGLDAEVVTLSSIAESYAKATVCDVIITVSRRMQDKVTNTGRLFIAKSRLGGDGMVYPFIMNTATVKATVLDKHEDALTAFMDDNQHLQKITADRYKEFLDKRKAGG